MYNLFWSRVTDVLEGSLFGRIYLAIVRFISNAFKQSWIYSFFSSKDMSEYANSSKIITSVRKFLFDSKLTEFISQSILVWVFSEMPLSFFSHSVSLLSAYFLPAGILLFVGGYGNITYMIISAVIILIAVLLFGVKTTIGSIIDSSVLVSRVFGYFDINTKSEPTKNYKKRFYGVTIAFGFAVGATSLLFDFKLAFLAFLAVVFLPMLIASPILLITATFISGVLLSSMPAFILSLLTVIIVLCRLFKKVDSPPKFRVTYVLVLLYGLITLYFTVMGFAGSDSMLSGAVQFILLSIFFSIVVTVNNFEKFKKLLFSLSTCTLVPSIIGVYQLFTGQGGTGWTEEKYVGGLARISSTFANPNVYGEFLILTISISAVALLISSNLKQRIFFGGVFALQIVNLALTYSRGCYISVLFAALIVIWCCDKRILGFGIFAVPVIPYVLPKNILTRIMSVGAYFKDTSVLYRFSIWKGSLKVIADNWFTGSGVGTAAFMLFYQNYMIGGTVAQHAHNTLMQIAIELSLLGLIVFLLILFFALKDVCNVVKNANLKAKFVVIPLLAAFAGVLIQCFVDYVFYNNIVFMVYWLVLGLLVAGLNVVTSDKQFEKIL